MELIGTAIVLVVLAVTFGLMRWGQKDDKGYDKSYKDSGYKDPGYKEPKGYDKGYKDPGHKDPGHKDPGYKDPGHKDPGHKEPKGYDKGYKDPGYKDPGYKDPSKGDEEDTDGPDIPVPDETEAAAAASSPQYKRINAWVAEREDEPEKPLALDETCHLNFNVGAPVPGSILTTPSANIAESDIPSEGLETTWVVTTENVELAQSEIGQGVKVERTDSPAGWKAGFTLFIPKDGSSETRQLLITPRQADEAKINVYIFARNTLYRQFRVELNIVAQAAPPPEKKKNSVAIRAEVIHMPAMHTGLQPQHEWQTPPGDLKIIVQGQKSVYVHGKTGDGDVDTQTNWNANDKQVATKINDIRGSAEMFRTKFSKQLNDIEPQDLEARLAAFKATPWAIWSDDETLQVCDEAHQQTWDNEIAPSKELYELAYHGYRLYDTFFPDKSTYPLRAWLDSLTPAWRVNISWPAETDDNWIPSVPWAFLYIQPVAPGTLIDPMNFWGLRFRSQLRGARHRQPQAARTRHTR